MLTKLSFLLSVLGIVSTASSGAKLSACSSMLPEHSTEPQTFPAPFTLVLSSPVYDCGAEINVTLIASESHGFKGFLCQARKDLNVYKTYGTLTQIGNVPMTNNCADNASLTHSEPSDKTFATFQWTAPENNVGTIYIVCTVVQSLYTYWINVSSPAMSFSGICSSSSSPKTSTLTTLFTTPITSSSTVASSIPTLASSTSVQTSLSANTSSSHFSVMTSVHVHSTTVTLGLSSTRARTSTVASYSSTSVILSSHTLPLFVWVSLIVCLKY